MPHSVIDSHVLILTPSGRDAEVATGLLKEMGVTAKAVMNVSELAANLADNVLFAVATEEALGTTDLSPLAQWVKEQKSWSDFLFVLLTRQGGGGAVRNVVGN